MFVDVLAQGGGGGIALERLKPYLLSGYPSGLKFSIANAAKDLGYDDAMAADVGAARGIAAAVLAMLQEAGAQAQPGTLVPQRVSLLAERGG